MYIFIELFFKLNIIDFIYMHVRILNEFFSSLT